MLAAINEHDVDLFKKLAQDFPRFISSDEARFKRKRRINNGYYIDTNLTAKYIYRFCTQATEAIELSSEDWDIEFN